MSLFLVLLWQLFVCTPLNADIFPGPEGADPWDFRPNDPKYEEMWQIFSHLPEGHNGTFTPWETTHGSGMSVDKAWQLHLGSPETLVAVLDSGVRWHESDLLEQHFLNTRELPTPFGSTVYDANHDGRVSVSDYANDPRVSDRNGNNVIDPGDLIAVFSDQVDDDQNGFVDDIAGWDFHENDNDPFDRTDFGHGTGEAKDSVASINNGIGGAGICGRCSVIFIRLNDSFIVDANAFAAGVIYAADIGVSVIQQALGSINNNSYVQTAVDYATSKDVVIVGSAADENSYHHNQPSTIDPIIYTNAIRYDTKEVKDATTFINFNNCSNYGARVDIATSGRSCSSEATGNLSGIVALARSYARSINVAIDPMQMTSMLKSSVDDIDVAGSDTDPRLHPTRPGWDMMTGYGRTNAYSLMRDIRARKIPPSLRVLSPTWFDFVVKQDPIVALSIKSFDQNDVRISATIQRGIEDDGSHALTIFEKRISFANPQVSEVRFSIPQSSIASLAPHSRSDRRFDHAITLVVRAEGVNGVVASQRRTFFVNQDQSLVDGFPLKLNASAESGATIVDLDNDGSSELVVGDGAGYIHAIRADGTKKAGFPVLTAPSQYRSNKVASDVGSALFAPLAIGDLDDDGSKEIISVSLEGDVSALTSAGAKLPGFPVKIPPPDFNDVTKQQVLAQGAIASPVLVDLDGDGKKEIVVVSLNGGLYVFSYEGILRPGFPFYPRINGRLAKLVSSPAVCDLDGDGFKEMVFGSNHGGDDAGYIFALSVRGEPHLLAGFPTRIPLIHDKILPTIGTGIPTAPLIGDFDGDGQLEIVVHAFVGKTYVLDRLGRIRRSFSMVVGSENQSNDEFMLSAFGHPGVAKFFGNQASIVGVGVGKKILTSMLLGGRRYDFQHLVGAWDIMSGQMLPFWPKPNDDMMLFLSPVTGDVDGDGSDEVFVSSGGYFLNAYSTMQMREDLSRFTGGWATSSPSLGDLDGDGLLDIAISTREGFVFAWKYGLPMQSKKFTWPQYKGNLERTGVYSEVSNEF